MEEGTARCAVCDQGIGSDEPVLGVLRDGRVVIASSVEPPPLGRLIHRACLSGWVRHDAPTSIPPKDQPPEIDPLRTGF